MLLLVKDIECVKFAEDWSKLVSVKDIQKCLVLAKQHCVGHFLCYGDIVGFNW